MGTTGGFQQYLIRKQLEGSDIDEHQPRKGHGSQFTTFHDLPESVQLYIFKHLDSKNLCRVCSVCSHWLRIASDELLWRRRLKIDFMKWDTFRNTTNPDSYADCKSDLHPKEIYLRCSPEVDSYMKNQNATFHSISTYIRSFLPKKVPKIAMFGPGMESGTSGIVRKILDNKSGLFTTTGMFPGQVRGLGSGFKIKVDDKYAMNYIPLYSNTKEQRKNTNAEQRLGRSRFFAQGEQRGDEEAGESVSHQDLVETFPITGDMKELLRTLDGYIFIVDASLSQKENSALVRSELFSMLSTRWCAPEAPLLVLACTPDCDERYIPTMRLVRELSLASFNRPWQICRLRLDNMSDCVSGLEWLCNR